MSSSQGQFLSADLMLEVKHRFHQVDHDHTGKKRLYFDNAGGAFRLKSVLERVSALDAIPDNIERVHTVRSEEHSSELQSPMRLSYAVFCLTTTYTHYTPA